MSSLTLKSKEWYETHPIGARLTKDTVLRFIQIRAEFERIKKGRILEVGCGTGDLGLFVSKNSKEYVGIDFSLNSLKIAQKYKKDKMQYVCSDAVFLPFKEKHFDVVLCSEVLEHIPHYAPVLHECFRVLRFFGKLLITIPNKYNPNVFLSLLLTKKGIGVQEYDNPPSFKKLLRQISETGFKIKNFYYFCPFLDLSFIISRTTSNVRNFMCASQRALIRLLSKISILDLYILIIAEKSENNQ